MDPSGNEKDAKSPTKPISRTVPSPKRSGNKASHKSEESPIRRSLFRAGENAQNIRVEISSMEPIVIEDESVDSMREKLPLSKDPSAEKDSAREIQGESQRTEFSSSQNVLRQKRESTMIPMMIDGRLLQKIKELPSNSASLSVSSESPTKIIGNITHMFNQRSKRRSLEFNHGMESISRKKSTQVISLLDQDEESCSIPICEKDQATQLRRRYEQQKNHFSRFSLDSVRFKLDSGTGNILSDEIQSEVPRHSSALPQEVELSSREASFAESLDVVTILDSSSTSQDSRVIITYPEQHSSAVTIRAEDLDRLESCNMIHDVIIRFYSVYLEKTEIYPSMSDSTILNSFVYEKLAHGSVADQRELIRRWSAVSSCWQKKFVFLPICQNMHWSLVILHNLKSLDHKLPLGYYLDSLGTPIGDIESKIRRYTCNDVCEQ
eukprot:TRINITY_DN1385_c0_g1_i3.p2 TRINITY_DN1385_c0_g1~~TRINITY_DN1385_c0_g1_i3.p2  ORF type:complete len:436 (+),score=79.58 TRINITY_DN1385_c0_g1_i3:67-1374(+)